MPALSTTGVNRPRRLLLLDHAPIWGGAEVVLLNLLRRLDRNEFAPLVATAAHSPLIQPLHKMAVPVATLPFGRLNQAGPLMPVNLLRAAWRVARLVRRHDIALIHSNTVRTHIVGSVAAALTRTPLVWMLHDNTLPPTVTRLLAPFPSRVIAVAAWLRDLYAPLGLDGKIVVIVNGLEVEPPATPAASPRREMDIPAAAPLVLNVGRLVPGKAPHLFIEAARRVTAAVPEAHFLLVGGPDAPDHGARPMVSGNPLAYSEELAATIQRHNLADRCFLVGHRADVDRFYRAADLVVYCSVQPEGLPTVLLEAMQHGKPVVASAIGGAVEIVENGVTGLLVPPADAPALAEAMMALLSNLARSQAMGAAARRRLEKQFDLADQIRRIEAVYRDILGYV
jgi:glycosyltransferase involved in cell wall biosynthesis